ncbi:PREDICTED: sentrin-specific protease 2-like [Prunus mume]|uniref:Sentrin-specific protease 2-like n=1 Tax=Prunus mume TaxID=102107 RepID=A0ABM0NST9_PRUMU|nr:PREDICTED: sentrin-specific protease 2-like [Prunus mume]
MSTAEGECGEDVIVGVRQKRGRGNSEILGPAMKSSHVRLCGEDGMEVSHNFFVQLLTKDGWLDDSNIDMALFLLRERHKSSGNWVGSDWTILDTTFQHNKGLLGMVKGEGPKLAKSWLSMNRVCLPFNLQRQKHWILLVVDLKECEIRAYDSKVDMCRTQAIQWAVQPVEKMLPRLLKESGYIGNGLLLKTEWPVIRAMDAPQQVGRGDCGMYILKYCEFLTSNVDLANISRDAMPFYRLKLVVQLLQGYW